MQHIINTLQEKTLKAFSQFGQPDQSGTKINVGGWKPNIIRCRVPDVDFTVNNVGSLFKINDRGKIQANINAICADLQSMSEDLYSVNVAKVYLNFTLNNRFLYKQIASLLSPPNIGCPPISPSKHKILVDYSSPNVAKDMHVGHLRSTIIGDCLANIFEVQGHDVHRINHIGDFGLQFGMIIQYIISNNLEQNLFNGDLPITLQKVYTEAKKLFDTNADFNRLSYENTVKLQTYAEDNVNNGLNDDWVFKIWRAICCTSQRAYQEVYDRLSVNLTECGESFYRSYIPTAIGKVKDAGLLCEEAGRSIIKTPYGVLTVIKSDGGYTYDTTDLTALWYRLTILGMDRVYYVVDSGQSTHFMQLFHVAKNMGWLAEGKYVEHINFGVICGEDNKRIRSRNGDTLKLVDLLDYSLVETERVIKERGKPFDPKVVELLAYGSIKYADLSVNRISDYIFSFERMLNFKGNTLAYVMYARVRIISVLRNLCSATLTEFDIKGSGGSLLEYVSGITDTKIGELNKYDYQHIFHLMMLDDMVSKAGGGFPNYICTYLYDLAEMFHNCYLDNRCISFENDIILSINKSRVALYYAILNVMDFCFSLLNIKTIDQL
jgi:arginyl-tRNA synthetase